MKCQLCERICINPIHSHPQGPHLCDRKHGCKERCSQRGHCEVLTTTCNDDPSTQISMQESRKLPCNRIIPPGQLQHDGDCICSRGSYHTCPEKCWGCSCFCNLPYGHQGKHRTIHGSMIHSKWATINPDVRSVNGIQMKGGESARSLTCVFYCRTMGRGHIHLVKCEERCSLQKQNGRRHQRQPYGPDYDISKDEVLCEQFFELMNFENPNNIETFGKCSSWCGDPSHSHENPSYCTREAWHGPERPTQIPSTPHTVSENGHVYPCVHKPHLDIFLLIDRSGSMAWTIDPTKCLSEENSRFSAALKCAGQFLQNRIEKVGSKHDFLTVIFFNDSPTIPETLKRVPLTLDSRNHLVSQKDIPCGGTNIASALNKVATIIQEKKEDISQSQLYVPFVVLISDGEADYERSLAAAQQLRTQQLKTYISTIRILLAQAKLLDEIATQGMAYTVNNVQELGVAFSQIIERISQIQGAVIPCDLTSACCWQISVDQRVRLKWKMDSDTMSIAEIPSSSQYFAQISAWAANTRYDNKIMRVKRIYLSDNTVLESAFSSALTTINNRRRDPTSPFNTTITDTEKICVLDRLKSLFERTPAQERARVVRVWHGCSSEEVANSILRTGFASLRKTDNGFFGNGMYVTPQAAYAGYYAGLEPGEHFAICGWAAIGLAYPVSRSVDYTEDSSRSTLFGIPLKPGFDAHFAAVNSQEYQFQAGPYNTRTQKIDAEFDELVVDQESHLLPRFKIVFEWSS
eukprot:c4673_g2_i1.p1 GENE.c4673_g2_i1~~c4673_g2_i1.p1  ORF type:complete len:747 (-),score=96.59 c4673_g2_i1:74-2314(-)